MFLGTQRGLVFRSDNGGDTWESLADGPPGRGVYALEYDRINQVVYAGLYADGFYRLKKGAEAWELSNTGITEHHVSDLIVDSRTDILFASFRTGGGSIFKSSDHGKTWQMSNRGMHYPSALDIVMHPEDHNIIYSGNSGSFFKSTDHGSSWKDAAEGLEVGYIRPWCLALGSTAPETLYFGASDFRSKGVYKSTDAATTWKKTTLTGTEVYALAVDPTDAKIVYAGARKSGIMKSSDGGDRWEPVNSGLPEQANSSGSVPFTVSLLQVDPVNSRTIYAGVYYGLFRSTEGGEDSWKRLTPDDLRIVVHSLLILDVDRLIIGTDKGVYVSKNGGRTWTALGDLPAGAATYALAYEPSTDRVYAGGNKGVFSRPAP